MWPFRRLIQIIAALLRWWPQWMRERFPGVFGPFLPPAPEPPPCPAPLGDDLVQDEMAGQAVGVPWVPLRFDGRIGATSAAAGDPQAPFHEAPDRPLDDDEVWMQDFTRAVPLHSTQTFLDAADPDRAEAARFEALLPSGGAHTLRRPPIVSRDEERPLFARADWNPTPVGEFLAIQLGDVLRFLASRTEAPSPLLPPGLDRCPPHDIRRCGFPR